MDIKIIDPAGFENWDDLLLRAGDEQFFHTSGWAKVLARSYRYKPVYFAGFEDGRLVLLLPFMDVSSPITGRRGVSLPFTDQCPPLAGDASLFKEGDERVREHARSAGWKYMEWR